jgi:DNA-binding transcriptional LysR family regulator
METIPGRYEQALAFLGVVEAGSFTRAAAALGRSKAWVSKCVTDLERTLGVQLLLRTTRRVDLTEAGRTYSAYCRQLKLTMLEAERAVSAVREEVAGTLRVTAALSFGEAFMPDLLVEFQSRHPALDVQLDLSGELRDLAAEGFDFAFRSARSVDDSLVARALGVLRDIPVASPAFLERHGLPRTPAELATLPALLHTHLSDHAQWLFHHQGMRHAVQMRGRFGANLYGPLRKAVALGAGIALLPRYLVADDLAAGRLVRLLPEFEMAPVPVYLVYAQRRHMPHRNRVFRDFVLEWFASPARAGAFD